MKLSKKGVGLAPRLTALLGVGALVCAPAFAQQAPDAGRVLQQNQQPAHALPPAPAPLDAEPIRPILTVPEGLHFKVTGFRISGAHAIPVDELRPLLDPWIGREVGFAELAQAADVLTRYYREHGYFVARAYLPAQDIKDGVVEILVLEGRLGRIEIHREGPTRIDENFLDNEIAALLPSGGVLRRAEVERAIVLINELPGVRSKAALVPGTEQATTNLDLDVREGPLVGGSLEYDNFGNKFTGQQRPGARLDLNDALGLGDALQLYYAGLSDNEYFSALASLPVGHQGLRLGVGYTYTNYHLCCDFSALDATGRARVIDTSAVYPFVRSATLNVNATANLDHKTFYNATLQGETSDKVIDVVTLGASLDGRDAVLGGGNSFASLAAAYGRLNHDAFAPDRLQDAATANTQGDYARANLGAARLQALAENWTLNANLTAQLADKNLDTAEKISLGGVNGVRSYPTNEAIGDAGAIMNLELRRSLNEHAQLFGLLDYGYVQLHHSLWPDWQGSNPALRNSYGLAGTGVGVSYERAGDFHLRAIVAERLGINPGRDARGNDSDGGHARTRIWLQAIKYL